jgi:serine/threonine protein kinase
MLSTNTILQDRYHVVRPLGRGGMGAVYEAFDRRLSRRVAIKETLVEGDDLRQAFEREAHLLANLRHPALPNVLDHFSEAGGLFVVMEFIPGDDLGAMLELHHSFPSAEVLRWADQLLDALSYLHALDPPVLHRDIKPANLKLIAPDKIVLLDFGLAKGRAGQMTHTDSRSVLAYSPNYSPLEQIQGTGTDQRSDLYALGATLYHLLTGVKPPDALTRATAVVNGQPDPLRPAHQLDDQVTATLSAAITRALALNIDQRPRTASEMLHDLHNETAQSATTVPIADVDEITKINLSPRPVPSIAPVEVSHREPRRQIIVPVPEETRVVQRQSGRGGRWKWIVALTLAVGLVALSSAFYLFYNGANKRRGAPTPAPTVRSSPRPTPTPTPSPLENANEQTNSDSQAEAGPAELEARSRLARKNIPFTEDAFTRVVEKGDTDAVDLFLAAGMSPDTRDSHGKTALIAAASGGSDEISRKLLSKGADPNARAGDGSTALMEAAQNDHKKTTGVLLENNSDVNLADNDGRTALIRAAARGHSEMVRILLNRGARVDLKDNQGRDALMWAEINDHSDVINLLRKAGAAAH